MIFIVQLIVLCSHGMLSEVPNSLNDHDIYDNLLLFSGLFSLG